MDPIDFHERTKHSPMSVRMSRHRLDWANEPYPFKDYLDRASTPLPDPAPDTGYPALAALAEHAASDRRTLDLPELTRLLTLGAGVLRIKRYATGERIYFRTYACAGALYPVEVYVACAGIPGLDAGLYHFHPLSNALVTIRRGDPRPYVARATTDADALRAPLTIVLSGIPWRTTWKYQARGYRHLFWDSGMIAANLLALAAAGGHRARVVLGFADDELNRLLGVDGETEMTLALVPLGTSDVTASPASEPADALDQDVRPLSARTRRYDELVAVHRATSLPSGHDAARWGRAAGRPESDGSRSEPCDDAIEAVIRKRGSVRAFSGQAITRTEFEAIVAAACGTLSADWGPPLVRLDLLVHAVDGMARGAYRFDGSELEQLSEGDVRDAGYFLCLEQPLGGDGAVTAFLMADLAESVDELGPRRYRAAQLEAGIVGGRLYLGAHACGFGATGLTFYDDEVRKFFATRAEPMLVVALGHRASGRRLL